MPFRQDIVGNQAQALWMSLNFLYFNEKKTEVMVFGGTSVSPLVDMGSLAQYHKPIMTIWG